MIQVTDLKGRKLSLNGSLIREMKKVPDTLIVLLNGNCLMVSESIDEIINKMVVKTQRIGVYS